MLNENIKAIRRSKGFSQEELAVRLNVVRQTISKWEQGLSVPDSDMLLSISEALETPVSILLGETVVEPEVDDLKAISKKLEIINLQLAQRKTEIHAAKTIRIYSQTPLSAGGITMASKEFVMPKESWDTYTARTADVKETDRLFPMKRHTPNRAATSAPSARISPHSP